MGEATIAGMTVEPWVVPVTLVGTRVRLEPLGEEHFASLAEVAFDPAIWQWTIARPTDIAALRSWFDTARAAAEASTELPFATVDVATGRAIGSTRFLNLVPEHRRLEIGWTWIASAFRRSGANREAKLLQLEYGFERLGANRIEFKTDSLNEPSRTALLGIGATFEGIFRDHMVMPDGRLRHSAWYSVTVDEWPAVRARLQASLER